MRKLVGDNHEEFKNLPASMFTLFRCFTDGCAAYDGTPLHARLRKGYGAAFMISYILIFLFVTIGIFNLIMAIFIDNVVTASVQRKQRELGESAIRIETKIQETIAKLLGLEFASRASNHIETFTEEGKAAMLEARRRESQSVLQSMMASDTQITKDVFQMWLEDPLMMQMLEEADIETATKAELFDVLDVDHGGELGLDELIGGLMRLRGPVAKCDIVAVRLNVRYLTQLTEEIHRRIVRDNPEAQLDDHVGTMRQSR